MKPDQQMTVYKTLNKTKLQGEIPQQTGRINIMRHTLPSPGAIKYIARDLGTSYQTIIRILIDLGYLYSDGSITPEGRIRGMREYPQGGIGASESVLNEIISVYHPTTEWHCDQCDSVLNDQEGFTNRYRTWVCKKCGYKNIVVNTGDNIRYI